MQEGQTLRNLPLSWYTEKLLRGEPFSSLVYGDGEFLAMAGLSCGEQVPRQVRDELIASLDCDDPRIMRGTDPMLLDPDSYDGQDKEAVYRMAAAADAAIGDRTLDWVDGTVWDTSVREGSLGPFLKALRNRPLTLVGHPKLREMDFLPVERFVAVPPNAAAAALDATTEASLGRSAVYLVCCGISAAPLIVRLMERLPTSTFLDLGSTFDVFVGLGEGRGWRRELYANKHKLAECIHSNLRGL